MKIHDLGSGSEALDNLEDICQAVDNAVFDMEAIPDEEFHAALFLASLRFGKLIMDGPLQQLRADDALFA